MKVPKSWKKVTPWSKAIAMILFITLPFVGFYFGTKYQQSVDAYNWYTQELNTIISGNTIVHISLTDNAKTVYVHKGDLVQLDLGGMEWGNPEISDTSVLVAVGALQYKAAKTGTTTITDTGRPVCLPHHLCSQLMVDFSTTVVVK